MDNKGVKFDSDKPKMDLISPIFLEGLAKVLSFGASKYEPYNWARGMAWSRVFAAMMRHMWKWWGGEERDSETGESHLDHAACCLMFLKHYEVTQTGVNDKPKYINNKEAKIAPNGLTAEGAELGRSTYDPDNAVVERRLSGI